MQTAWLLLLLHLTFPLQPDPPDTRECCKHKLVAGESYTLLEHDETDTLLDSTQCLNNCFYSKDSSQGTKYCFGIGAELHVWSECIDTKSEALLSTFLAAASLLKTAISETEAVTNISNDILTILNNLELYFSYFEEMDYELSFCEELIVKLGKLNDQLSVISKTYKTIDTGEIANSLVSYVTYVITFVTCSELEKGSFASAITVAKEKAAELSKININTSTNMRKVLAAECTLPDRETTSSAPTDRERTSSAPTDSETMSFAPTYSDIMSSIGTTEATSSITAPLLSCRTLATYMEKAQRSERGLTELGDPPLICTVGENNSKSVNLFDNAFSFGQNMTNASCCSANSTRLQVTCGRGSSCEGKCSALGATLCPTGNCTDNLEDCTFTLTPEGLATSFCSAKGATLCDTGRCADNPENCNSTFSRNGIADSLLPSWVFSWCSNKCRFVKKFPACCYNPVCLRKRRRQCKWLENYMGATCPRPADIEHGTWTCSTQEIPIKGSSILDEVTTY